MKAVMDSVQVWSSSFLLEGLLLQGIAQSRKLENQMPTRAYVYSWNCMTLWFNNYIKVVLSSSASLKNRSGTVHWCPISETASWDTLNAIVLNWKTGKPTQTQEKTIARHKSQMQHQPTMYFALYSLLNYCTIPLQNMLTPATPTSVLQFLSPCQSSIWKHPANSAMSHISGRLLP